MNHKGNNSLLEKPCNTIENGGIKVKRIGIAMAFLVMFCGTCFAEPQWEQIGETTFVDVSSIKVIQVDYDEFVKATIKCPHEDNGYGLLKLMINKDTKEYGYILHELYNANGTLTYKVSHNPKDHTYWRDGTNKETINEILKRVP